MFFFFFLFTSCLTCIHIQLFSYDRPNFAMLCIPPPTFMDGTASSYYMDIGVHNRWVRGNFTFIVRAIFIPPLIVDKWDPPNLWWKLNPSPGIFPLILMSITDIVHSTFLATRRHQTSKRLLHMYQLMSPSSSG